MPVFTPDSVNRTGSIPPCPGAKGTLGYLCLSSFDPTDSTSKCHDAVKYSCSQDMGLMSVDLHV